MPAVASPPHDYNHQPHMELLSRLWGIRLYNGPTGWNWRTSPLRGDECSAAYGASHSASVRADEWGGESDKLGHTNIAFLGNAVKNAGGVRLGGCTCRQLGQSCYGLTWFPSSQPLLPLALRRSYTIVLQMHKFLFLCLCHPEEWQRNPEECLYDLSHLERLR